MAHAHVYQLNASNGGVPKLPLSEAQVTELGIEGDDVMHPEIHGGPERALCIYALERIESLAAEGHPIAPGTAGENLTIRGLDWELVQPGARIRVGAEVVLEVTRFTTPCATIRGSFIGGGFNRIHHATHPGWSRAYTRVLATGVIRTGDAVEILGPEA